MRSSASKREHLAYRDVVQRVPSIVMPSAQGPHSSTERLWTVRQGARSLRADLIRDHRGWHVHFLSNEHWFASESVGSRELAINSATAVLNDLIGEGWVKTTS
jgi:hypothetical protein